MERSQAGSGIDADFAGQVPPGPLEPMQRLGLPAGPVQGQHELGDQPFITGTGRGLLGQAADQRAVLALAEPDVAEVRAGRDPVRLQRVPHGVQPWAAHIR